MNLKSDQKTTYHSNGQILLLKKQIKEDLKLMKTFCEQRLIKPSLKNFLSYKEQGSRIPACIYFFMGRKYCKFFFFNSRKWNDFFLELPKDFQNDVASPEEIKKHNLLSLADDDLNGFLSNILGDDFIGKKK